MVANLKDSKGLIKLGNERVINARLNDAEFFWKKNKSQNLLNIVKGLKRRKMEKKSISLYTTF